MPAGVAKGVLAIVSKRTSTSGASDIRDQALPTTVHDHKYAFSCGFGVSQPSVKGFPVSEPTYQKTPTSLQVCSPKMFSPSQDLALYWLLPTMVSALNIPIDQGSINQPYLPSLTNITGTNVLLNDSSTLNAQKVTCLARWGEPPVDSCADARAQVPADPSEVVRDPTYTYGPRGQGTFDVGLPRRYISSTLLYIYVSKETLLTV